MDNTFINICMCMIKIFQSKIFTDNHIHGSIKSIKRPSLIRQVSQWRVLSVILLSRKSQKVTKCQNIILLSSISKLKWAIKIIIVKKIKRFEHLKWNVKLKIRPQTKKLNNLSIISLIETDWCTHSARNIMKLPVQPGVSSILPFTIYKLICLAKIRRPLARSRTLTNGWTVQRILQRALLVRTRRTKGS